MIPPWGRALQIRRMGICRQILGSEGKESLFYAASGSGCSEYTRIFPSGHDWSSGLSLTLQTGSVYSTVAAGGARNLVLGYIRGGFWVRLPVWSVGAIVS
jgi:hypothetical protein